MNTDNNLDLAIEELIKKRVKEATEDKDTQIKDLTEALSTLQAGGSYAQTTVTNYNYSGEDEIRHRYFQSNDKNTIYLLEEEITKRTKDKEWSLEILKRDLKQKYIDDEAKYEEMKKALIKSNPWYIKLAYTLKRRK